MSEQTAQYPISLTLSAAQRIKTLISNEGNLSLKLRVYIVGGGCSGFRYGFTFDDLINEDDIVVPYTSQENQPNLESQSLEDVNLVVDALSLQYLIGAQVDYQETLQGAHFVVINPNAQTTCGCGSSFSI